MQTGDGRADAACVTEELAEVPNFREKRENVWRYVFLSEVCSTTDTAQEGDDGADVGT